MPDLPTLTVTTPVSQRLLAAFSGQTDLAGQPLTPVQAYKQWLRANLTSYVISKETQVAAVTLQNDLPLS